MTEKPYNVLFLCTGNSARSVLAESILNKIGNGRFKAFSAGSHPSGAINPHVLEFLEKRSFPTADLRSKSWNEFAAPDGPALDFVFTVCDNAAGEVCPVWPGQPVTAHWGMADPAADADEAQCRQAFNAALLQISRRIRLFVDLPHTQLERMALTAAVRAIAADDAN